jgi:hypothetical protein
VSHTRAGLLFALPHPTQTASLLPGAEEWKQPLEESGVRIVETGTPDLVVAPAALATETAATGAQSAILLGARSSRTLDRAGYTARGFLPIPSIAQPSVLVPLDQPRATRYALSNLSVPSGLAKRLRNIAAGLAIAARAPVPGAVVLASRTADPPFPIRCGQELGLPATLDWFLVLGRAIERSAFFLFEPGARKPSWVLKFSPDHRNPEPFLADERGLRMVEDVGGVLLEHATRLVGVSTTGLLPLTVESAALGAPLVYWLRSPGSQSRKRAVIEAVSRWLIEVQVASAAPGRAVDALSELRFPDELVTAVGADVDGLTSGLGTLPGVVEHSELDPTHVLVDGDSFTVIDWEGVRRHGLPFADLAFFLAQVLPILDGELDDPRYSNGEVFARLFRGESPSSPLLFELMREACEALDIAPESVGPLLSLTWLRLALGPIRRYVAEVWFADPALGPGWTPWQQAQ